MLVTARADQHLNLYLRRSCLQVAQTKGDVRFPVIGSNEYGPIRCDGPSRISSGNFTASQKL